MDLNKEIEKIKERNKRVELEKNGKQVELEEYAFVFLLI